jgi:tetratricopeptide (TPR) repeat protein
VRPQSSTLLAEEALSLLESRDAAAAGRIAEELLRSNSADVRALLLLARSRMVEAGPEAAIESVRRYAESQPRSPVVWHFLGELLFAAKQTAPAVGALEKAMAASARTPTLEEAAARAELLAGNAALAQDRLIPLVAADPTNYSARFLLGVAHELRGEFDAAAEAYRRVLDGNPSNVPALYNLAYVLAERCGKPEEALHLAEQAREMAPESAAVDDVFGWVLYRRGLYSLADIHLSEAAASGSPRAFYHLAMERMRNGDAAGARRAYQEGLRRAPQLPEAAVARLALNPPPEVAAGAPTAAADPVALGWVDLGAPDNAAARMETYQKTRGCAPDPAALDAVLHVRDPRQFTARAIVPLMLCEPQPPVATVSVPLLQAAGIEELRAMWTNPELMLQGLLALSGVNAEMPGWDNTFISWDGDRRGRVPKIEPPPYETTESSFRPSSGPRDEAGWDVYDSLWPGAFR